MTQHTTSSSWFATEILELIILESWSSPLSLDERISFMVSSLLVSKAWSVAFIRVSSRDAYIPCASYADQFFRILREESPTYDEHTRSLPDYLCRSITFQVHGSPNATDQNTGVHLFNDNLRDGQALATSLYTICSLGYLPHLRRVSIEYVDWGFDDVCDHYRLVAFPDQVTELELKYTFNEHVSSQCISDLRADYEQWECLPWCLPSIRHLSVLGAPDSMVADILPTCPNVEMLVKDGTPTRMVDTS